jgi:peptidoglycan/LPS O-acetylase OafA/YrhL
MSRTDSTQAGARPAGTSLDDRPLRRIAWLLLFVAGTLGVASALHLSGNVHGSAPFDADHAGIAEAVIGLVLAGCASIMLRAPARARTAGLAGTVFAIVGFGVGLSFTTQGGHAPDIAYHVVVLPMLLAVLVALVRHTPHAVERPHPPLHAAGAR